jgi:hypothetical protein
MEELTIKNKQQYLQENYPFADIPRLTDERLCLHCDTVITVGDYKVYRHPGGTEFICCPNAPECNGTVIDWMELDE